MDRTIRDFKTANSYFFDSNADDEAHSTCLVVNRDTRQIEYYEPHGAQAPWLPRALAEVKAFMVDHYPRGYRVVPNREDYQKTGVQVKVNDSRCESWASLFLYLRVRFPTYSAGDLQQQVRALPVKKLRLLQKGWSCYLWKYAAKSGISERWDALRNAKHKQEIELALVSGNTTKTREKLYEATIKELVQKMDDFEQGIDRDEDEDDSSVNSDID